MMVSPLSSTFVSASIESSTALPALTMTRTARGGFMIFASSSNEYAGRKSPWPPKLSMNSSVRCRVRLYTATRTPWEARLRARFMPIVASPTTPISFSGITKPYFLRVSSFGAGGVSGLRLKPGNIHGDRSPCDPQADPPEPLPRAAPEPLRALADMDGRRGPGAAESGRLVLRRPRRARQDDQELAPRHQRDGPSPAPGDHRRSPRRVDGGSARGLAVRGDGTRAGRGRRPGPGRGCGGRDPGGGHVVR